MAEQTTKHTQKTLEALRKIHEKVTAKTESVVRCKDCEYYENSECVCPYIWMSDGAHMYTQADDFCSYAKRRADNESSV